MSRLVVISASLGLALILGACSSPADSGKSSNSSTPIPTPDQALVPTLSEATLTEVDATIYDDGYGWFSFKVGNGPTWCTITMESDRVLCEHNEAAAEYPPIPMPANCDGSYGYQIELFAAKPEDGEIAGFPCATGQFQDPINAQILESGSKITVGSITCFVEDVTARCDNTTGQWIALGPKVWSLNS